MIKFDPIPQKAISRLVQLGAVAAIAGGTLRIIAAFVPYVPQSAMLETLYFLVDIGMLLGLCAIFYSVAAKTGWLGMMGFLIAFVALASIVGPDTKMFGVDFYLAGSAAFEVGLLTLSIVMLVRQQSSIVAIFWLLSAFFSVAVALGEGTYALMAAGLTLGLGFLLGGIMLIRSEGINIKETDLAMAFNQVTIGCSNLTTSIAFYRQIGFRLIANSPENGYARFEAPNGATLSLHKGLPVPAGAVLYFEAPNLDEWCKRLERDGIAFDKPPRDESWGWREARLKDPDENPLCLFHAGANRRFPPWRILE